MARMNVIAETARLTEAPLWERARAMCERSVAAIGQPAAIAAVAALLSELRGRIVGWLLLIETIVRKLLLAEAAACRGSRKMDRALSRFHCARSAFTLSSTKPPRPHL